MYATIADVKPYFFNLVSGDVIIFVCRIQSYLYPTLNIGYYYIITSAKVGTKLCIVALLTLL